MPGKNEVLVLVGPMGVGKTTIGKKLAKLLSVNFSDTDAIFTASHGPIDKFFAEHGEAKFREFETVALREAISSPGVVATGGGAVLSDESKALLATTTVIYLATDGKHIASRLAHGNRPLLKNGMSDWRRIYDARKSTYEQVADFTVDTSSTPLATTIAQIREKVGR
jgi:shikimate kinase